MTLTHASLFTGQGGFDIAAHVAGFDNAFMCEIDPFCQSLLKLRFPGVPIIGDVKDVTAEIIANAYRRLQRESTWENERRETQSRNDYIKTTTDSTGWQNYQRNSGVMECKAETRKGIYPAACAGNQSSGHSRLTLLSARVPCQPASIAGKRRGKGDDRWLWPEAIRVLSELQPSWAVFENPAGIASLGEFGKVPEMGAEESNEMGDWEAAELDRICGDIEAHGYEVQPVSIPASAVGAPHSRERIFIICNAISRGLSGDSWRRAGQEFENGYSNSDTNASNNGFNGEIQRSNIQREHPKNQEQSGDRRASGIEGLSSFTHPDTHGQGLERYGRNVECPGEWFTWKEDWERNWVEVAAELCGVDDGRAAELDGLKLSKSKHRELRIKALGNAVVWKQVYPIFKIIADIERGTI